MKPVIYTHVPKTGGSTIGSSVINVIGDDAAYIHTVETDSLPERLPKNDHVSFVGGHIRFPVAFEMFGEGWYFGSVREPVERILSNYFFALRYKGLGEGITSLGVRDGFDVFYDTDIRRAGRLNLQCRFYADDAKFDTARKVIRNHYAAVWDMSRVCDGWPLIAAVLKADRNASTFTVTSATLAAAPQLLHNYVAPIAESEAEMRAGARPADYRSFLDPETIDRIIEENAEDMKLHAWLREQSGLFVNPARIRMADADDAETIAPDATAPALRSVKTTSTNKALRKELKTEQGEVARLTKELARAMVKLRKQAAEIEAIRRSKSWRLTGPLRRLGRLARPQAPKARKPGPDHWADGAVPPPVKQAVAKDKAAEKPKPAAVQPTRSNLIVVDGSENANGRALMAISALTLAAPKLGAARLRFINVRDPAVRAAVEILRWDAGLQVEWTEAGFPATAPRRKIPSLFLAVAFRPSKEIDDAAMKAARIGIPALIAVQFPTADAAGPTLALTRVAHDLRLLADRIVEAWEARVAYGA